MMAVENSWAPPPPKLELSEDEIHLWRARLEAPANAFRRFELTLSFDERERAGRFHFARDRSRFIVARGILRILLSRYARVPSAEIAFEYNGFGKPSLAPRLDQNICFNLSHSDELAVFAFARGRKLGVDVEILRPDFGGMEIAKRLFTPQELEELGNLPATSQVEGYFLCWTRKEAYIKARGEGLTIPLDSFSVSLTPDMPARLYGAGSADWTLTSLRPHSDYVGALVAQGKSAVLRFWDGNFADFV